MKTTTGKSSRIGRVNDLLQKSLAILIRDKCKDPRLGMITIAGVETTPNLEHAKVLVTVLEDEKLQQSLVVLNNAAGFLRTELAHMVNLRIVPKLKFVYDNSLAIGMRIDSLLDSTLPHT